MKSVFEWRWEPIGLIFCEWWQEEDSARLLSALQ